MRSGRCGSRLGAAIPAAFLVVAAILAIFSVGYVAMTRYITNSGACYAFVARGIGRPAEVAAALVALVAYTCLQVGLYGAFGPAAAGEAAAHLGVHAPWWAWALCAWAVITLLGLLRVDITGWVLGVLLTAEVTVILAETIAGLAAPAGGRLSFATLSPIGLTSGGFGVFGVLAVVAVLGFVGFEQAPVLAEEARHPRRTIPVATSVALGMIAIVYAGASWAMAVHNGDRRVVTAAAQQGPGLLFGLGGGALGQAVQLLFLTSLFAAALAFHNVVWRYMFALGRENVLPAALGRTGTNNIPKTASLIQSATGLAVIVACVASRQDPMNQALLLARHNRKLRDHPAAHPDRRGGDRVLRPRPARRKPLAAPDRTGLAAVLLAGIIVLAIQHYATLLGVPPGSAAAWALPAAYAVAAVIGLSRGLVLKIRRPQVYAAIGLGAHAVTGQLTPASQQPLQ